jgi:hypothetical protein
MDNAELTQCCAGLERWQILAVAIISQTEMIAMMRSSTLY